MSSRLAAVFYIDFRWSVGNTPEDWIALDDKGSKLFEAISKISKDAMIGLEDSNWNKWGASRDSWMTDDRVKPNIHFQGFAHLKARQRPKALAVRLNVLFRGISIRAASTNGVVRLKEYAVKDETNLGRIWTMKPIVKKVVYTGKDLWPEEKWPPWQKELKKWIFDQEPHDRHIIWLFGREGENGKSKFIKTMAWKHNAMFLLYNSANNLQNLVYDAGPRREYFINMTKSKPKDIGDKDMYAILEMLKDGMIQNGKFKGGSHIFDPPHVVVMANHPPCWDNMAKNRFRVYELPDMKEVFKDDIPPVVDNHAQAAAAQAEASFLEDQDWDLAPFDFEG